MGKAYLSLIAFIAAKSLAFITVAVAQRVRKNVEAEVFVIEVYHSNSRCPYVVEYKTRRKTIPRSLRLCTRCEDG